MTRTAAPFVVRDCALITLATGRTAHSLRELRDGLAEAPFDSLRHHLYEHLLRPSFDDPEMRNDFAAWALEALRDDVLAERLSALDPFGEHRDEALREALLDVVDDRIAEAGGAAIVPAGHEFHFLRAQLVVFRQGTEAATLVELAAVVPELSPGGVYYHFVDARLRTDDGRDDFSVWLAADGDGHERVVRELANVDPMFGTLGELRRRVARILSEAAGAEGSA